MPELRRSDPRSVLSDLERRRLLIVSGKGGVGRTTVAALLGSALASKGRKVLVATTGHDDRLAWMLGGERLGDVPTEVAPGLEIQRLVPATCVEEYAALITHSQRLSHMVFGNKTVRRLLRAIPGLDDFAILGKVWHEAVRARSYDTIVFDGPASGHLRLVLGVPKAILETLNDGPLTDEAMAMRDSLQDPDVCSAVLVGLPEPWPLTELGELSTALRREIGMGAGTLVVNKLWPLLPALGTVGDPEVARMLATVDAIGERGREQRQVVAAWHDARGDTALFGHSPDLGGAGRGDALITVPWWPWGVEGPEQLHALLTTIQANGDAADAQLGHAAHS